MKKRSKNIGKRKPHAVEKPAGRRTLLTEAAMSEIEDCLKLGNSHKTAYTLAGVSRSSFYEWLLIGEDKEAELLKIDVEERQKAYEKLTEHEQKCMEFSDKVKKAIEWGKKRHVSIINQVAQGGFEAKTTDFYDKEGNVYKTVTEKTPPSFPAAAWLLERRHPGEFALRGRIDINENRNVNHNINIKHDVKVELSNANAGTVLDIMAECGAIPPPARGIEREAEVE